MMPSSASSTGSSPSSGDDQDQIIQEEYKKCMLTMLEEERQRQDGNLSRCPWVWDGIMCWGEADAGETAVLSCPAYVAGFNAAANATRQCMETGEWQLNSDNPNATWTNYSQCAPPNFITTILVPFRPLEANVSLAHWIPMVKTMSKVGYSVSLITLVVAFLIMASIKKLRCPRNMLHMHLFASFMMRAFMSLLKDKLFIEGVDMSPEAFLNGPDGVVLSPDQHGWECKLVIGLWEFFIMANYSWVLMEGLYLHNLIFLALFSDTSAITLYVILGWGLPVLVIVPWVVLRAVLEDTLCWTTHDNPWFFLVIRVPISATVLINFVLFVNIVRVLLLKLQSSICEETRKYRYRRWAKSTLVLVPLFGVHYTLFLGMSYSMGVNYVVEIIWLFCDQFFASFQGSFVAILYCFMNGEVRAELYKIWLHHHKKKDGKAQWWLSSGYADGSSSRRTSKAGGTLLTFPRKSRDMGKCGVGGGMTSNNNPKLPSPLECAEDKYGRPGPAKSTPGGGLLGGATPPPPQQPVQAMRFPRPGRGSAGASSSSSPPDGSPGRGLVSSLAPGGRMGCWSFRKGEGGGGGGVFGVRKSAKGGGAGKRSGTGRNWRSRLGIGGPASARVNGTGSSSPYTSAVSYSCHTTHCSIDYGGGGGGGMGFGGTRGSVDVGEDYTPALWPPLLGEQGPNPAIPATVEEIAARDKSDGIPLKIESREKERDWKGEIESISYMDDTQNTTL